MMRSNRLVVKVAIHAFVCSHVVTSFTPHRLLTAQSTLPLHATVGPRLPIVEDYPGLIQLHANPDVFLIDNFLDISHCENLIQLATDSNQLERSPVAYAGWTRDFTDLLQLAAKGPIVWASLGLAWYQLNTTNDTSQVSLVIHALQNYGFFFLLTAAFIGIYTTYRAQSLQTLRTSTSTTLDDLSEASVRAFVSNTARLLGHTNTVPSLQQQQQQEASLFEAPTIIRYETGQVLAPHFDANPSADTEDANRGGQTLVTVLLYLNDVQYGGWTKFNRIDTTVQPSMGQALVFFPADAAGTFDERTEHEGCPAVDEKWIARIWRHQHRVPPPFGLSEDALRMLS